MKKIFLLISFSSCVFHSFSQNLVPNPDFEIYGTVPCSWTISAADFAAATNSWTSPTQATPDIFSTLLPPSCTSYQPLSTDPSCNGYQVPHSGDIFAGFYTQVGGSDWREYLQVPLTQPMVVGNEYHVSLYVSLSDHSQYATNNIGVGFSTAITNSFTTSELGYAPQINHTELISDTVNWVYLSDTIVPTDAWQYIIIGNFFNDGLTSIVNVNSAGVWDRAYYYVDDVSVEEINESPATLFTANDTSVCEKFCVSFFDSSTNNPTAWQWIFPGASPPSSTDQNPSTICYDDPGTYDVTLITTNANGNDTLTLSNYITVLATPAFPTIIQNGYTLTSSSATTYQWQLDATDIPGATDQSYDVQQTGFYTVIVSDENGCKNSATLYVLITGIDQIDSDFNFSIYPNPTLGSFTVELLGGEIHGEVLLDVVNALGQKVFSSAEKISSADWKKQIDLTGSAVGFYFVEIKSSDKMLRRKIVLE